MPEAIRVLISEANPGEGDILREILGRGGSFEIVGYAQDGLEAAQLAYRLKPDVALLWEDLFGLRGPEACELVARTAPEVASVIILRADNEEGRKLAMMAGARAVIGSDKLDSLPQLLLSLYEVRREMPLSALNAVTQTERMPLVIMVTGGRGGVGKTTLAVNLAARIAQDEREKVVVAEMPGQLGDASVMMDAVPTHSFYTLIQAPALDADVVQSALIEDETGVRLLAATSQAPAADLSQFDRITNSVVSNVLGALKRSHTVIILDCPPHFWPIASYLARRSHLVVLVATPDDLASVRNAATMTDLFHAVGLTDERLVPVINRATGGSLLKPDDVAKAAGWSQYSTIPTDNANCVAAINEGAPLVVRSPASPAARAIAALADDLLKKGRALAQAGVSSG
ncbi:MAG: AAA family ATPase [Armatimonadetes bacterium]|nr:AAA family ATPase [Armatimonadota bacterium]